MAKISQFEDVPSSNSKPESLLKRILSGVTAFFCAAIFLTSLPLLIISFLLCSCANELVHAVTGGYLLKMSLHTGEPADDGA